MAFIRPSVPSFWRKTTVPNFPVEVDWNHPLSAGLLLYLLPGVSNVDLVNGLTFAQNSTTNLLSFVPTPMGPGVRGVYKDGALVSTIVASGTAPPKWQITRGSLIGGGVFSGTNTNGALAQISQHYVAYGFSLSGATASFSSSTGSGSFSSVTLGTAVLGPSPTVMQCDWAVGGNADFYQDGALVGSVSMGSLAPVWNQTTSPLMAAVGQTGVGTTYTNQAAYAFSGIYSQPLGADLGAWLRAEPFAMLRPKREVWYYSAPSGGGNVYNETISEAGSGADLIAALATFNPALTESGTVADAMAALATMLPSLTESGSAADTVAAARVMAAALAETGNAADALAALVTFTATLTEAGSAADALAAANVMAATLAEAGNATDTETASGSGFYTATIAEAGNATDALVAVVSAVAAYAETGSALDALAASNRISEALAEAGNATDAMAVAVAFNATFGEAGAASDGVLAAMRAVAAYLETGNAADALVAIIASLIIAATDPGDFVTFATPTDLVN